MKTTTKKLADILLNFNAVELIKKITDNYNISTVEELKEEISDLVIEENRVYSKYFNCYFSSQEHAEEFVEDMNKEDLKWFISASLNGYTELENRKFIFSYNHGNETFITSEEIEQFYLLKNELDKLED